MLIVLDGACSLRREVGGGWALKFESFLGPVKWHRADRRVPFGAQKTLGDVRGVLGNKCAGHHNYKMVKIRGVMSKQNKRRILFCT